jgi:hypothetical protein
MARRPERRRMATKNRDELTKPEEKSTILGLLAEQHARERYGLRIPPGGRTSWKDAEYQNGTPVNPKAAQPDRRFRIFEEDHDILTSQQGYYVFVVYEPVTIGDSLADSKIDVKAMKRKKATDVTKIIEQWNESGHEKGRQHKIPVKQVFK